MAMTMNYDFTYRPNVRPRRSWDAIVITAGNNEGDNRAPRGVYNPETKRPETKAASRYIQRNLQREKAYGEDIMRADRLEKHVIIDDAQVPQCLQTPRKWGGDPQRPQPVKGTKYYHKRTIYRRYETKHMQRFSPAHVQQLFAKGATWYPTEKETEFVIVCGTLIGVVSYKRKNIPEIIRYSL